MSDDYQHFKCKHFIDIHMASLLDYSKNNIRPLWWLLDVYNFGTIDWVNKNADIG